MKCATEFVNGKTRKFIWIFISKLNMQIKSKKYLPHIIRMRKQKSAGQKVL